MESTGSISEGKGKGDARESAILARNEHSVLGSLGHSQQRVLLESRDSGSGEGDVLGQWGLRGMALIWVGPFAFLGIVLGHSSAIPFALWRARRS